MKISSNALSRKCRRSLEKWPNQVWQRFEVCVPNHAQVDRAHDSSGRQLDEALLNLLRDASLSPELRVSYVYLILHGRYIDSRPLAANLAALVARDPEATLELAWSSNDRRLGRRRFAYRVDKPVIDVTRYVDEFQLSGIPRVVRNLIGSAEFADAHLVVWDDGAPCPVWRRESAAGATEVWFSPKDWITPHQRTRWIGLLWSRLMHVPIVSGLLTTAAGLLRFAVQGYAISSRRPNKVLVLDNACLLVLEITRTSDVEAMMLAKQSFSGFKLSAWVHDLLPIIHPEFFTDQSVNNHLFYLQICLQADVLFAATPIIKRELYAFAALHNRPCPPVVLLQLPVTTAPRPKSFRSLPPQHASQPYFVFMGGFGPRKGLRAVMDYLVTFLAEMRTCQVWVIGSPMRDKEQLRLAANLQTSSSPFRLMKPQSDTDLMRILSQSRGVLYPSMAEGFGLPVLEAISLGVPVITRPTEVNLWLASQYEGIFPVFREQDSAALLLMQEWSATSFKFNGPLPSHFPDSVSSWASAIRNTLDSTHIQTESDRDEKA